MKTYKATRFWCGELQSKTIQAFDIQDAIYTLTNYGWSIFEILSIELVPTAVE